MTKNTFTLRVSDSFSFFVMLIFSIFAVFTILSIFSGPKSVLGAETEKNMEPTQLLTQEESQAAYETLIDLLRNPGPCYSSKTHLFYSVPIEKLPSLARFRDMDPNPVGYGSGADDCTLYGGTLLFGLVELYDLTHDDALRPLVYDAWLGMRNVGSAHHIWGFVSRGLHPDDKTATYATSSRDQYTHYAESLWRFYRSPLCDEETRGEIRELLAVLADSLMEEITQENDFSILRADGMHDPRGLHKMWNVYAHESARLPMIYAAAWEVTGDDKYYQECQKYLDVALEDSLSLPTRPRSEVNGWVPTYSFYQMQCSLELLEAVIPEADPKGKIQKEKIRQAIQQTAEFASIRIPGLVNRKAGRREFAEILIAQTILPTLAMTDETRTHLRSILLENGMRTTYPGQTVHLVRAYANACKNGSVPLPKTVGKTENSVNETTESAQENMLAAEKEPFAWVHKPAMGRINPNLVVFCEHKGGEEGQLEAQKISTMYPQPAKIVMWNTGRGPVEISLKAENPDTEIYYIQGGMTEKIVEMPRADLILTDTLTAEQVERWRKTEKRTKPFFVLLASAPTVKDTELWETLKLESAAFQGVLWGDGPEPYELKLNEMLKKTCFKIPLTFAYLQLDRWEFALRPISLMPGDLKARMARIYRMTPELVATFPESQSETDVENKSVENKSVENKSVENKSVENKSVEDKNAENKNTENKNTENKNTENKNTENKNTENVGNLMKSGDNAEFVRVSAKTPDYLELSSGKPYLPIGVNLCILRAQNPDGTMRLLSDEEALQKMEFYFQRLSENGGNYARVWLGMPQFDIETERPGHFDAQKIENVHRLLDLASRYGIRLKFCLEHFRNLGDSPVWNDGKVTFSKRLYHGEVAQKMSDFTLSDAGRNAYLARTRKYIDLFGSHPAVFGWELWNEVNCIPNADVWTEFMLARVTEMNPNQLVFQSLGSFDSPAQFERYRTHTKMRQNTLLQVHRYLDPGAKLPICQAPMDVLAADCATTVRAWGVRKPILVTELGAVRACHAGPSELYEMDTEGVLFHDILFAPFFAGAAAPGHCWHWHVYLEQHDLWRHVGRFSEAVRGVNPVSEQFQPFYEEQNGLRIYGLRGEKTVLVWIRDAENDSQRELIEKKPVETRKDVKITISENYTPRTGTHRPTRLDIYHPWEDRHETVPLPASATIPPTSQLTLPPLTRSCVLRIEGGE